MFILRHEPIISQGQQYTAKSFGSTFFPSPATNYQSIVELDKRLATTTQALAATTQALATTTQALAATNQALEEAGIVVPRPSTSGGGTSTTGGGGEQSGAPQDEHGSPPSPPFFYPEGARTSATGVGEVGRLRRRTRTRSQLLSKSEDTENPPRRAHENYGAVGQEARIGREEQGAARTDRSGARGTTEGGAHLIDRNQEADPPEHF